MRRSRKRVVVRVESPGPLGIRFTLDTATCLPTIAVDAHPTGRVALENGERALRAGDRVEEINGTALSSITAWDEGGSGVVDRNELRVAVATMGLRDAWLANVASSDAAATHVLTNDEIADQMLASLVRDPQRGPNALMHMMLNAATGMVARSSRPLTMVCTRATVATQVERRTIRVVVEQPGSLGIGLSLNVATCMAVLGNHPAPEGQVHRENPDVLRVGDRLESVNGTPLAGVTAFDEDGDGVIDRDELHHAVVHTLLGEVWLARPANMGGAKSGVPHDAIVSQILAAFDSNGSGVIEGEEKKAFMKLMLQTATAAVMGATRPLTLVFSRPVLTPEAEQRARFAVSPRSAASAPQSAEEQHVARIAVAQAEAAAATERAREKVVAERRRNLEAASRVKAPRPPRSGRPGDALARNAEPLSDVLNLKASHDLLLRMRAERAKADEAFAFSIDADAERHKAKAITFLVTLLQRRCVRLAMRISVEAARSATGGNALEGLATRYTMVIREDSGKATLGIFIAPDSMGVYTIVNVDKGGRIARQYGARCRGGDVMLQLNGVWIQGFPIERIYEALGHSGVPLVMHCGRRNMQAAKLHLYGDEDSAATSTTPLKQLDVREAMAWLQFTGNGAFGRLVHEIDGTHLLVIGNDADLNMFDDAMNAGEKEHLLATIQKARDEGVRVADIGTALHEYLAPHHEDHATAVARVVAPMPDMDTDFNINVHDFEDHIKKPKKLRVLMYATLGVFGQGRHRVAASKMLGKVSKGTKGYTAEKQRVWRLLVTCKILGRRWRRRTKKRIAEREAHRLKDLADKKRWRSEMLRDKAERARLANPETKRTRMAAHALEMAEEAAALEHAAVMRDMQVQRQAQLRQEQAAEHAAAVAHETRMEAERAQLAALETQRKRLQNMFPQGEAVEGNFRDGGRWLPARILTASIDSDGISGIYHLLYDNGDEERDVALDHVRRREAFAKGEQVEGNFNGKGEWRSAKIASASPSGDYDLLYDNGGEERGVSANRIRHFEIFVKGDQVDANMRADGTWLPAKITYAADDGTFDLIYENGEREEHVLRSNVRRRDISSLLSDGDDVEINYKGKGRWFAGTIMARNDDGTFEVCFNNGDEEHGVQSTNIRFPSKAARRAAEELARLKREHQLAVIASLKLDVEGVHARIVASKRSAHHNPLLHIEPNPVTWRGVKRAGPPLSSVPTLPNGRVDNGVPSRQFNRTWVAPPVGSKFIGSPTSVRAKDAMRDVLRSATPADLTPEERVPRPERKKKDAAALWLRVVPAEPARQAKWLVPGAGAGTNRTPFFMRCTHVGRRMSRPTAWYEDTVIFPANLSLGIGVVANEVGGGMVVERVSGHARTTGRVVVGDIIASINGESALEHRGAAGMRTFAMQLREAMVGGKPLVLLFAREGRAQLKREACAMQTIRRGLRKWVRTAARLKQVEKDFAAAVGSKRARVRRVSLI